MALKLQKIDVKKKVAGVELACRMITVICYRRKIAHREECLLFSGHLLAVHEIS